MNRKIKIYSSLSITVLMLFLLMSSITAATPGDITSPIPRVSSNVETVGGIVNILENILRWVYTIFFIVAALFIIIAAFHYLTAQGNPEKVGSAKDMMIYAVVAIVIALIAMSIPFLLRNFIQGGGAS